MVLAEYGDVRYDVHGGDVGGEDDDAEGLLLLWSGGGGGGGGGGGFAEGFDDFFYAAFEGFVFGGWGEKKGGVRILRVGWGGFGGENTFFDAFENFLSDFLVRQWVREWDQCAEEGWCGFYFYFDGVVLLGCDAAWFCVFESI